MKKILLALSFLFLVSRSFLFANEPLSYNITKNPYRFSTYFEMQGERDYEGRVISNCLHVRTCYDLYDGNGTFEAQGICRALSIGTLCDWAKEIDVYDDQGNKIGFIEGKTWTTAKAKFNFYDGDGNAVAFGYLDYNCNGFVIHEPSSVERPIARLKRNYGREDADHWDVLLYDKSTLDPRLLKIFSAFAVDHQDSFKS